MMGYNSSFDPMCFRRSVNSSNAISTATHNHYYDWSLVKFGGSDFIVASFLLIGGQLSRHIGASNSRHYYTKHLLHVGSPCDIFWLVFTAIRVLSFFSTSVTTYMLAMSQVSHISQVKVYFGFQQLFINDITSAIWKHSCSGSSIVLLLIAYENLD